MNQNTQHDRPESVLPCLRDVLGSLEVLLPRLHEANKKCAEASRPLANLPELTSQQRRAVAEGIRATNQDVDEVFALIQQALASLEQSLQSEKECNHQERT